MLWDGVQADMARAGTPLAQQGTDSCQRQGVPARYWGPSAGWLTENAVLILPVLALLLAPAGASSVALPEHGLILDRWGRADGLPLDHLNDLAVGDDDRLWLATVEGLWSFDGVAFASPPPAWTRSLGTARVWTVLGQPGGGALWILGEGQVGRLVDGEIERWQASIVPEGAAVAEEAAVSLTEDAAGLWLRTDARLYRITGWPEPWHPELFDEPSRGHGLGPDGSRWVAFPSGLVRVRPDGTVQRYGSTQGVPLPIIELRGLETGGPWIRAGPEERPMAWDGEGFVASSGDHLGPFTCSNVVYQPRVPCRPVHGGGRWRASTREVYLDGEKVLTLDSDVRISAEGRDGSLWIATGGDGLLRLRSAPIRMVRRGGADERVVGVWLDDAGEPWFATPSLGWWRVGASGPEPVVFEADRGPVPPGAYLFRAGGQAFAAGLGMLLRFESTQAGGPARGQAQGSGSWATGVASTVDERGRSWLATVSEGLLVDAGNGWGPWLDGDREVAAAGALAPLPGGEVLVAQRHVGLARTSAGGLERIDALAGRALNTRHLRRDGERMWVSTEDEGLCVIPDVGLPSAAWTLRCIGRQDGLPATGAHQSIEDRRGRTWVSTNHGLAVVRTSALDAFADGHADDVQWLNLDESQGMATSEANGGTDLGMALDGDGVLWVATQIGAVALDTTRFELPAPPAVTLRAGPGPLLLEPDHAPVQVDWSAPSLLWGEQVRYRSRLGGGAWSAASPVQSVQLARLAPGPSVFEVQAGLAGAWGPAARLELQRTPGWRERPEVWALLALTGTVGIAGAAALRQRALAARARLLEAVVRERTHEVRAQAEELASQRDSLALQAHRLRDLADLRTRMIVNLHHELRTPLALVLGPLREREHERDADLRLVRSNAERLATLLEQLGDVAHLEAGSTRVVARRGSLTDFARRCLERFHALARGRAQTLRFVDAGPELAWFDPDLLDKALANLVGNALKFTPVGGTVEVGVQAAGESVEIRVADTGPGVPEADRERVFERLYQVRRDDARPHEGSGLGLAIAKEVVELHGGTIGLRLREGGGSEFWFQVPRGVGHLAPEDIDLAAGPSLLPRESAPPEPAPSDAQTILVVEDNDEMRAYLCAALSEGRRVLAAADGREGLEILRRERPSLVVSDVMMPGLDGLALARAVRADPELAGTRIILVSAKTRVEDRAEALEVADAWLSKPFYLAELRAHVRRLLARPHLSAPGAPASTATGGTDADQRFADHLREVALARLGDSQLGLPELARLTGVSERSLQRRTVAMFGAPPSAWLLELRLEQAEVMLRRRQFTTVGEVAAAVGLSRSYFTRAYRARTGRAPGDDLG